MSAGVIPFSLLSLDPHHRLGADHWLSVLEESKKTGVPITDLAGIKKIILRQSAMMKLGLTDLIERAKQNYEEIQ